MGSYREYSVVWRAVYDAVPESETDYRRMLVQALERAKYRAPEIIHESFDELAMVVNLFAHPINKPPMSGSWQMGAVCALTGKSEEWVLGLSGRIADRPVQGGIDEVRKSLRGDDVG